MRWEVGVVNTDMKSELDWMKSGLKASYFHSSAKNLRMIRRENVVTTALRSRHTVLSSQVILYSALFQKSVDAGDS